jgi:hypothetical protein
MNLRKLKDAWKLVLRKVFEAGQHLGLDVLPRHFYSEVPDLRVLRHDSSWKAPFSMAGIRGTDMQAQTAFLKSCLTDRVTAHLRATDVYGAACRENGAVGFGPIEAQVLFGFVASQRPLEILQIGCGVTTALCVAAANFAGYSPRITCVEPYPTALLKRLDAEGAICLIQRRAQDLDIGMIDPLGEGSLFFVDSTHTLGPAGEVSRIILEMLPRLKPGARVHFHDIYFPFDYGRQVLDGELFFWHESVLLQAFLTFNSRFSILLSCSMLHYEAQKELRSLLPNYSPEPDDQGLRTGNGHFPSSTYMQVSG